MSGIVIIWTAIAAALGSGGLVLALLPTLNRHVLATPNARSLHRKPTPQGGGIAVTIATIAISVAVSIMEIPSSLGDPSFWMPLAAVGLVAMVGAIDDVQTIEVLPRLLCQTIAAGIVIASIPAELRILPLFPYWVERTLMLLAVLWFLNLTNFMDGLDLMTVAEFVPILAGLTLLGFIGVLPAEGTIVAAALIGALIGFAPFNCPTARLFLGDVGSLPVGLLVGWLLLMLAGSGHLTATFVMPLYYLADATLTLLSRIARGEPFWRAHRSHFYQRATERGFSATEIILSVFVVNLILTVLAIGTVLLPGSALSGFALTCGGAMVGALLVAFARGRS